MLSELSGSLGLHDPTHGLADLHWARLPPRILAPCVWAGGVVVWVTANYLLSPESVADTPTGGAPSDGNM